MKQNALIKRECNYDLLRIICTVAVVTIHMSATYVEAVLSGKEISDCSTASIITMVLYHSLSRFAVPCFVMLTGAFLLDNDKNAEFKGFYKKSFKNVFVHVIIISLMFFAYSEIAAVLQFVKDGSSFSTLVEPVISLLKGKPWYHMWYMYMLLGVYAVVPVLILLKNKISEKSFAAVSWIYLIIAMLSGWASSFKFEWNVAKVACYIGFILVGYQIRKSSYNKNNVQAIILILVGFMSQLGAAYFHYRQIVNGINDSDAKFSAIGNFNPIIVFSSVLIFAGFSKLDMKAVHFGNLPKLTFYIYLLHPAVRIVWDALVDKIFGALPKAEYFIPLSIVMVFILSYLLSLIYNAIWQKFNNKTQFIDKILNKI